ncbi:hypothetical protein ED388_04865 [Muribaculaceae bacterium Isolate-007 (NCI)]|nr:hypothetical protein EEL42_03600 [Muribaculaceae bacterium Isolate-100 (HZI)]RXE66317.1 hypothetical protein ED388_04865 [Muribaculaceae bacterium Isolate-007 (NCI)]
MYSTPETDTTFDKYDEMRLHMAKLYSASIIDFDMPMRIAIPLDNAGIRKIGELVRLTRKELLKVRRLGEKGADEVEKILDRFGLSLGMTVE